MLFDCGKVQFRLELAPEYKANRPPMPEDLRALYIKKGFGIEHVGDERDWQLFRTHELADVLAADLMAMGPLHQLMQRMRRDAEHAQQELARLGERETKKRAQAAALDGALTVHGAEEFEF